VGRTASGGFTAVLSEEPVRDVLAVLCLDDGLFDRACIATGGLVPLAVVTADVPALDFHDGDIAEPYSGEAALRGAWPG
jgi:hypothetical protein